MNMQINTICHADRLMHEFFGQIDILNIVNNGRTINHGDMGWATLPDCSRVKIRVKSFWKMNKPRDPSALIIIVDPLPLHPSELEGCPLHWGDPE